ncbi:uncharacterized protein LOC122505737 [Leptopilina heterotoma]|uniref:uncharacterized protein LOC122505737 n=1 Tax=Leptopilina heterotoma TaxID=63436 RepID=UPI001CA8BC78|nr:uncharacterized protein LOC122505737 [Leptopilina heterotoma]
MRRWKTSREFGYSKRHRNRILKRELENDWKELMEIDTEDSVSGLQNSTPGPIASTSGRKSSECIPNIGNDESLHDSDSSNSEIQHMQEDFSEVDSRHNKDFNNFVRFIVVCSINSLLKKKTFN